MGGTAKSNRKTVIKKYDTRPLPEDWQHTEYVDHLRYKGTLVKVKDRGKGMIELQTVIKDKRVSALGNCLEDAISHVKTGND